MVIPAPEKINPFKDLPNIVASYYGLKNDKERTDLMKQEVDIRKAAEARTDEYQKQVLQNQSDQLAMTNFYNQQNLKIEKQKMSSLGSVQQAQRINLLAEAYKARKETELLPVLADIKRQQATFQNMQDQVSLFNNLASAATNATKVPGATPEAKDALSAQALKWGLNALTFGNAQAVESAFGKMYQPSFTQAQRQQDSLLETTKQLSSQDKMTGQEGSSQDALLYLNAISRTIDVDNGKALHPIDDAFSKLVKSTPDLSFLKEIKTKGASLTDWNGTNLSEVLKSGIPLSKVLSNSEMYDKITKALEKDNSDGALQLKGIIRDYAGRRVPNNRNQAVNNDPNDLNPDGLVW